MDMSLSELQEFVMDMEAWRTVILSELQEMVMDMEAWSTVIHGVTKSQTWLSDWTDLNWTDYHYSKLFFR